MWASCMTRIVYETHLEVKLSPLGAGDAIFWVVRLLLLFLVAYVLLVGGAVIMATQKFLRVRGSSVAAVCWHHCNANKINSSMNRLYVKLTSCSTWRHWQILLERAMGIRIVIYYDNGTNGLTFTKPYYCQQIRRIKPRFHLVLVLFRWGETMSLWNCCR
jgi:hypothetical protein